MAYAMTKRGTQDNAIVYEFVCDTIADMNAIENKYRTIGSIAVVLQGETEGLEVYIAGSNKQWGALNAGASDATTDSGLTIYICSQEEVDNGLPDIDEPDSSTIYLVPASEESGNLYDEYIYVEDAWEKFGSANIDLSGYAPIANPIFTGSISLDRKANQTVGANSFAVGQYVTASGANSHSEGYNTTASGAKSHAEGEDSQATGRATHAEGYQSTASGSISHAEGNTTVASGDYSHAEGWITQASGNSSHAEGYKTTANGAASHASGMFNDELDLITNWATNTSYSIGDYTKYNNAYYRCKEANNDETFDSTKWDGISWNTIQAFVVGNGIDSDNKSNAMTLDWTGDAHFNGNVFVDANADGTGGNKLAKVSELPDVSAKANKANAVFTDSISMGRSFTSYVGQSSTAIGNGVKATGGISFAIGEQTTAAGTGSVAEGAYTNASTSYLHVSGRYNVDDSLSNLPTWVANTSYAAGDLVVYNSHAYQCKTANSDASFTSGNWYQLNGEGLYVQIVGNGPKWDSHSNAYALDWYGNGHFKGDVYVGCNANSTGGTKLTPLPTLPGSDGTYTLQVVISSGVPTYSWVASST